MRKQPAVLSVEKEPVGARCCANRAQESSREFITSVGLGVGGGESLLPRNKTFRCISRTLLLVTLSWFELNPGQTPLSSMLLLATILKWHLKGSYT